MKKSLLTIFDYNIFYLFVLLYRYAITKIFYRGQKIIRHANRIRGKKYISFKTGLNLGVGNRFDVMGNHQSEKILFFGENVEINDYCHIACISGVYIGNNVLIGSRVFITDHNHGNYSNLTQSNPYQPAKQRILHSAKIHINDNVWIGEGVTLLPGVNIGVNSIIGSNSLVNRSIPSNSIAVGIPARVVKTWDENTSTWIKV